MRGGLIQLPKVASVHERLVTQVMKTQVRFHSKWHQLSVACWASNFIIVVIANMTFVLTLTIATQVNDFLPPSHEIVYRFHRLTFYEIRECDINDT